MRCWVTDTHTHTHRPSTVTLAAHARRGLIRCKCAGNKMQKWWTRMRTLWRGTLVSSLVCRFRHNSQVCWSVGQLVSWSVGQFRTLKNEEMWSYRSKSVWYWLWWWFHPSEESQVEPNTPSPRYRPTLNSCMYVVMYCSSAKSGRLICIGRRRA